jgi:hypothetical protein
VFCCVCGFENPANARFCGQCGAAQQPISGVHFFPSCLFPPAGSPRYDQKLKLDKFWVAPGAMGGALPFQRLIFQPWKRNGSRCPSLLKNRSSTAVPVALSEENLAALGRLHAQAGREAAETRANALAAQEQAVRRIFGDDERSEAAAAPKPTVAMPAVAKPF